MSVLTRVVGELVWRLAKQVVILTGTNLKNWKVILEEKAVVSKDDKLESEHNFQSEAEIASVKAVSPSGLSFDQILGVGWMVEALEKMGIVTPTPVQAESLPMTMEGRDMVIQAETGSGKTLAFSLPLIAQVRNAINTDETVGFVLTPTRELAIQVVRVIEDLCPDIKPVCVIGGMRMTQQFDSLESDPRVVVGTPGRILDLLRQKRLYLSAVSFFALDEADEMLSMGFIEEVERILERVPTSAQGVFVSATISPRVKMLAERFLKRVESLEVETKLHEETDAKVEHLYSTVGLGIMEKPRRVIDILEKLEPRSAIVFCNTKSDTELVEAILKRQGRDAQRLNSDLTQKQRNKIMEKLRGENLSVLIATDLAARGIDIAQIDLVINYSLPDNTENYVHRTGRTGRAGRHGVAATIIAPSDIPRFHEIKKVLDIEFKEYQA